MRFEGRADSCTSPASSSTTKGWSRFSSNGPDSPRCSPKGPLELQPVRVRRSMRAVALPAAIVLFALGCRDEQAGPRPKPKAAVPSASGRILEVEPEDLTYRSGGTWAGGAIVYLGSRVSPVQPAPGQPVVLSHYFRADKSAPPGFHFFVHLLDATSGQMVLNADHEIQGGGRPPESWPVGKVIEDVHVLKVPPLEGRSLRVLLGFWNGDRRLEIDRGSAQDGDNRMLGPTIEPQHEELAVYRARRAAKPPVIDGRLDDEVWRSASAVELVRSLDGGKPSLKTVARLAYDDENLYVAFDCEDPDVWGTLRRRDDPIYTEEAVEIFIDADGDGKTYNEIEVSPNNTVFDAYFPARRQGMDTSWDSGVKSAVLVRGTLNDPSDRDKGWTVEMRIPFARLHSVPHVPPQPGDRWRFNLYRLEMPDRKNAQGQAYSPLFVGDFHAVDRFAWLVFER